MTWIVVGLVLLLLGITWFEVINVISRAEPIQPSQAKPESFVWSGRVFATQQQFAAYLASRGLSYRKWAASHPDAAAVVDPLAHASTSARAAARPTTTASSQKTSQRTASLAVPASASSAHSRSTGLVWLGFVLGVLAAGGGAALLYLRARGGLPYPRHGVRPYFQLEPDTRAYLGAGFASTLVVVAVLLWMR